MFVLGTGCGGGSSPGSGPSSTGTHTSGNSGAVAVATRNLPRLGTILVDSHGRTLYLFAPDEHSRVTCTGTCAAVWPPLKLPAGLHAKASGQAQDSLLGSDPDPAGGRVVTYDGWPLYTYVADRSAGVARGQAVKLNGGYWYVLSPAGKPIRTKSKTPSTSTGYGSGGGYG